MSALVLLHDTMSHSIPARYAPYTPNTMAPEGGGAVQDRSDCDYLDKSVGREGAAHPPDQSTEWVGLDELTVAAAPPRGKLRPPLRHRK